MAYLHVSPPVAPPDFVFETDVDENGAVRWRYSQDADNECVLKFEPTGDPEKDAAGLEHLRYTAWVITTQPEIVFHG